jgi:hypothetical protein
MNSLKDIVEDMTIGRPQQFGEYTATIQKIDGYLIWTLKSKNIDTSSLKQIINAGRKWKRQNAVKNNLIKYLTKKNG